ncbi:hypothetical protein GGX14DRAFT_675447 [Mycena pura]|uniref:Arrestin-like N-terminal domain-containing protein n=1 Tax=Mycena pura TaxID=153505 RepID=A0AAD6YHQ0_9AGAR|nr:hypothetical protein GGX14DRAFT_675447 [Mycena pura]
MQASSCGGLKAGIQLPAFWPRALTLTLLADPRLSRDLPVFAEGGDIAGFVKLNLSSKEAITGVSLLVTGDIITIDSRLTFFRMQRWIWAPSMGDPRAPMASGDNLVFRFHYFTIQRPGRPSVARQLAYQNNTAIPDPYSDPDGWQALEPVQIRGTIFGNRAVDAKCTVYLDICSLRYTRGTAIPCAMTIETADAQAADLLASIKSSCVFLQRTVKFSCSRIHSLNRIRSLGQATWWPSLGPSRDAHQRHIMGEVHLSIDLQPSSTLSMFEIEYAVALFPPEAAAFAPEKFAPLTTQVVEIVTSFAPGVRQQLASPPVYNRGSSLLLRYYRSLPELVPKEGKGPAAR